MPMSGGASDKAGHRYEVLWSALCVVDVVLGTAVSVHFEPPDNEAVEFKLRRTESVEYHQVKRGNARESRWRIPALEDTLRGFATHLGREITSTCTFVSGHAAHELDELCDRARVAPDLETFLSTYLAASASLTKAFDDLLRLWAVPPQVGWNYLQRIHFFVTISIEQLGTRLDRELTAIYATSPEIGRALFCQIVTESTHIEASRDRISAYVTRAGLRRRDLSQARLDEAVSVSPPPPAHLYGRDAILDELGETLQRSRTVTITGPSGIGKSAICTNFCAAWASGPVIWVDCMRFTSWRSSLQALEAGLKKPLGNSAHHPRAGAHAVGATVARHIDDAGALVVWDGLAPDTEILAFLSGIAGSLTTGAQLLTTQSPAGLASLPFASTVEVPALSGATVVTMILALVGRRPNEVVVRATRGHPYLVHLAANTLRRLSDDYVVGLLNKHGTDWVSASVLSGLTSEERRLLEIAAIFRAGFDASWFVGTTDERTHFSSLVLNSLVVRSAGESYAVHDMIRDLVLGTLSPARMNELHELAARRILPFAAEWLVAQREYAHHTMHAGMMSEAQRALTAFVQNATLVGHWSGVLEATQALPDGTTDPGWGTCWYLRGRAFRLSNDLEAALRCYRLGRTNSDAHIADVSAFEEASTLALLGDANQAKLIYGRLLESEYPEVSLQARISVALIRGNDGDYRGAAAVLGKARAAARSARLVRAEAEVEQVWGIVALRNDRAKEARKHLSRAYELRMSQARETVGGDQIGWHALYRALVEVETVLQNRRGAGDAAWGLFNVSVTAGLLAWIAEATFEVSNACGPHDSRTKQALPHLRALLRSASADAPIREITAYMAAAYWCSGHFEAALACILEHDQEDPDAEIPVAFYRGELQPGVWSTALHTPAGWIFVLPRPDTDKVMSVIFDKLRLRFPRSERLTHVMGSVSA